MKLIFLDVDGVINSTRSAVAYGNFPSPPDGYHRYSKFDDIAVRMIRRACKECDAQIVLSSTWRLCSDEEFMAFRKTLKLPMGACTPRLIGEKRGVEIKQWLDSHPQHNVEKYAIVDDDSDMLPEQINNFVKVDGRNGFSFGNYQRLVEILGKKK